MESLADFSNFALCSKILIEEASEFFINLGLIDLFIFLDFNVGSKESLRSVRALTEFNSYMVVILIAILIDVS